MSKSSTLERLLSQPELHFSTSHNSPEDHDYAHISHPLRPSNLTDRHHYPPLPEVINEHYNSASSTHGSFDVSDLEAHPQNDGLAYLLMADMNNDTHGQSSNNVSDIGTVSGDSYPTPPPLVRGDTQSLDLPSTRDACFNSSHHRRNHGSYSLLDSLISRRCSDSQHHLTQWERHHNTVSESDSINDTNRHYRPLFPNHSQRHASCPLPSQQQTSRDPPLTLTDILNSPLSSLDVPLPSTLVSQATITPMDVETSSSTHPYRPRNARATGGSHLGVSCDEEEKVSGSTLNWCVTQVHTKRIAFTWTIENFSLCVSSPGETVTSDLFSSCPNDKTAWCLQLAPHGKNQESKHQVSVHLLNVRSESPRVPVRFRCSLLSPVDGQPVCTSDTMRYHLLRPMMNVGFSKFFERDTLYTSSSTSKTPLSKPLNIPPPPVMEDSSRFTSFSTASTFVAPGSVSPDCVTFYAEVLYVERFANQIGRSLCRRTPRSWPPLSSNPEHPISSLPPPSSYEVPKTNLSASHKAEVVSDVTALLDSGVASDVTLTSNGRKFKAHKVILAAASSVLREHFLKDCPTSEVPFVSQQSVDEDQDADSNETTPTNTVPNVHQCSSSDVIETKSDHLKADDKGAVLEFNEFNPSTVQALLRFIYSGTPPSTMDVVATKDLFLAADKYDIGRLRAICLVQLSDLLTVETVCDLLAFAHIHNAAPVKQKALDFFVRHSRGVISTPGFDSFAKNHPDLLSFTFLSLASSKSQMDSSIESGAQAPFSSMNSEPSPIVPKKRKLDSSGTIGRSSTADFLTNDLL